MVLIGRIMLHAMFHPRISAEVGVVLFIFFFFLVNI
jgi:hypothetical protein